VSIELSDGTKNIIAAMKKHGVRRLLVVSSIGAGDSKGQGVWWVKAFYRYMLKYVIWDKDTQERRWLAGGAWGYADPVVFRSPGGWGSKPEHTTGTYGFRLVRAP